MRFNASVEETSVLFPFYNDPIGAAYLVRNKAENKEYIAKKILLGSIEKNEQDAALLEVNLLKNLNHPNVVAYKTSFITQGLLIIVMENCEGKLWLD
jgi:NIMA (never in mitosis gene a)-related kinase